MPLTFDHNLFLKRGRGRPSAADRELERRFRDLAAAELTRDLDPTLDDIDGPFTPGTSRHRKGPPALSGRSAKFIGLVAAGANEEAARVACKLQKRALRRLLVSSPIFQRALAGARAAAAALSPNNSQNAPGALSERGERGERGERT